jgi:hypothetical protein
MGALYRIYAIRDESAVLPKGTWKRFEDVPFLAGREKECQAEVLDRLSRFGQAFDPDRWDSVSVNPFIAGNQVAYWGVYGETIVVEGQYYVNDVVEGDTCCVSPTDEPFWCLHRGALETNDHELYRRLVAAEAGQPGRHGLRVRGNRNLGFRVARNLPWNRWAVRRPCLGTSRPGLPGTENECILIE